MKTDLISLPACVPTATALQIDQRAPDKDLLAIGRTISVMVKGQAWWLADLGIELRRRKLKEVKTLHPDLTDEELDNKARHYVGEVAEVLGIDTAYWHNCVSLGTYFESSLRSENPAITPSHHHLAMQAAGGSASDPKKAVAWLLKAEENQWTVAQMRQQVRQALATGTAPNQPPEPNPFEALDDADHWAITQQATALSPEMAKACLVRFTALIAFIERLKEAAGEARSQV